MKAILENVSDSHDEQVTLLFEDARNKLHKVVANSDQQKKKIVEELAKNLEGKIPTDTISMEIVNQLRGQVSEGFVRECLDEKYKQKRRVQNARKQKRQLESKVNDKLAQVTTLNQDDEEEEKKELIMVDVAGRTSAQKDEDEQATTTTDFDTTTDRTFVQPSYQLQPQQEQEQELKKAIENSSQLVTANKMVSTGSENKNDVYITKEILKFEFSMFYKDVQKYMAVLFRKQGGNGKVWFSGKIDKKTGVVISSTLGKINQHQQQDVSIDFAKRDDNK